MRLFSSVALIWLALAVHLATPSFAQPPSSDWRTLEMPGFRFHTPVESEAWTRHVMGKMEAIQELVEAEIGYAPVETVDVLVVDPVGRANGTAWPVLGRPRMVLYTTPPSSDSVLGYFSDWSELLSLHESVHLVHLLRPSRNPAYGLLEHVVPVGPLVRKSPNWLIEGYATLLEGRLTGLGRPNGDYRAAVLRRWAQAGRLPTYGALSGTSRRWLGRGAPYLVGSAFLEWLEARAGADSLPKLWARMSARQERSFEEAFRGVFGESPSRLYDRFTAEVTYRAMSLEANRAEVLEQGELWKDLSWQTGMPAVSPDGERLAAVVQRRGLPARLVIWSTADDPEAEEKRRERETQALELDPEDVPAVIDGPPPRKVLFELPAKNGAAPREPRFTADGESMLFVRDGPASASADFPGARVSDLYRWWPESGRVERITRNAGVRRPDPSPDGRTAVAVRYRHGLSEVVRIDLASGEIDPLWPREPSVTEVLDFPRLSPDGERLAYLAQRGRGWTLVVRHLPSGTERRLPTPARSTLMHPAWTRDGKILVTVGSEGFLDIFRFDPTSGARLQLTRSPGAALGAAPAGDAGLFFLAMEEDGFDIRRLQLSGDGARALRPWVSGDLEISSFAPAVRPAVDDLPDAEAPPPAVGEPVEVVAESYGTGPREHFPLAGGSWGPDGGRFEFGLRQGDPVGRLELWLLGAVADPGTGSEGVGAAMRYRGLPTDLALRAYSVRERPASEEGFVDREGLELLLRRHWRRLGATYTLETGALWDRVEDSALGEAGPVTRKVGFLRGSLRLRQSWDALRLEERLDVHGDWGQTGDSSWRRYGYDAGLWVTRRPVDGLRLRLGGLQRRWESEDLRFDVDRFELGGWSGSLVPRTARPRLDVPALPTRFALADEVVSERLELEVELPVTFFWERHRVRRDGSPELRLRLVGVEWTFSSSPVALLRLPGVDVSLGAARILDPPFEDQDEGWIGIRWRP